MEKFIHRPSIDMFAGIIVHKDTKINYSNENVKQTIENLKYNSSIKIKGENYKSEYITEIDLEDGDVLIFEDEGRGYIKPVENFCTIDEAIEELKNIK